MTQHEQQLGFLFDAYRVTERVSVKARSIRVEVLSATEVALVIPRFCSKQQARDFLHSRDGWIRQKIAEFKLRDAEDAANTPSPHLRWDGTDLLPLRGIDTPLKLVPAHLRTPKLRFDSDRIALYCAPALMGQHARLERFLRDALRKEAQQDAQKYLRTEAARLGVSYDGPRIADQKTLWGSCTPAGLLSFSWRLILTPAETFRYVVIHELCHRVHLDHSDRFWALVQRQMPDYEGHRHWLREHGRRLHWYLAG